MSLFPIAPKNVLSLEDLGNYILVTTKGKNKSCGLKIKVKKTTFQDYDKYKSRFDKINKR
jgi:hypothetical protein